jgi:hypothetical protein
MNAHRDPSDLPVFQVCPHCKAVLETCRVRCGEHAFETYSCPVHGDVVVPVNSHVRNPG